MSINVLSSSSRSSVTSHANYRRGMLNGATNSCALPSPWCATSRREPVGGQKLTARSTTRSLAEAMECAASLDVMKLRKVVAPERYEYGIRLLEKRGCDADEDALTVNVDRPRPRRRRRQGSRPRQGQGQGQGQGQRRGHDLGRYDQRNGDRSRGTRRRSLSKRMGATVVEVQGSHTVYVSQPGAVAHLIEQVARSRAAVQRVGAALSA